MLSCSALLFIQQPTQSNTIHLKPPPTPTARNQHPPVYDHAPNPTHKSTQPEDDFPLPRQLSPSIAFLYPPAPSHHLLSHRQQLILAPRIRGLPRRRRAAKLTRLKLLISITTATSFISLYAHGDETQERQALVQQPDA